jgi:hypothetical protein
MHWYEQYDLTGSKAEKIPRSKPKKKAWWNKGFQQRIAKLKGQKSIVGWFDGEKDELK